MIDWLRFLQRYRVDYITQGTSVVRGNVAIKCPFCGDADPSYHLGISLAGQGWGCWRNRQHRGVKPHRLIRALIGCSAAEASRLAGTEAGVETIPDESVLDRVSSLFSATRSPERPALRFAEEMRPLEDSGLGRNFIDYLVERKYTRDQACDVACRYELRYAYRGPFAYRVIIPIFMDEGLATWTGRAISDTEIRYKTLTHDIEKAKRSHQKAALLPIDECLFNYQELLESDYEVLIVNEGPFDAIRLDYFGRSYGVRATCIFGTGNLSDVQVDLLAKLSKHSQRKFLMFDKDAELHQLSRSSRLAHLGFESVFCPLNVKDPAMINQCDLPDFYRQLMY